MSILQADGIQFGNGTSINTKYFVIPKYVSGTPHEMFFYQSGAPTGWTKSTSHNNKALRVVTGDGRGTGGTSNFTTIFNSSNTVTLSGTFSGSVDNTTLTVQQIPSHQHINSATTMALSSAGSSPFRQAFRQPRGYSFRAERRVQVNTGVQINFRQPSVVRTQTFTRVDRRYRRPLRSRQPRAYRQRRDFRTRVDTRQPGSNTFNFRGARRYPYVAIVIGNARRRILSFTNDRQPRRAPFRQVNRVNQPDRYRQPRRFSYNFRQPRRQRRRRPRNRRRRRPFNASVNYRGNKRVRFPFNNRVEQRNNARTDQRSPIRVPQRLRQQARYSQPRRAEGQRYPLSITYNFRFQFRTRYQDRYRNPFNNRTRYSFRQRRSIRYSQPNRTFANQRNPDSYRQPRTYRAIQRYPATNNNRVELRTLTPGGQIRATNTQAPATSNTGGGQAHNHGFTGSPFSSPSPLSLRIMYVDIILCRFDP